MEEVNKSYIKTCLYHKTAHPLCPVFNLGYVVRESGLNFSSLAEEVGEQCQAGGQGRARITQKLGRPPGWAQGTYSLPTSMTP